MPLEKLTSFTKKVQDLSDKPNATMTAAEVKAQFDAAPDEVRVYLNKLITVLESTTDGDSGADNISATPISTSPANVQGILEWLKTQIDSTVLGQIPDGSITDVKLSDEPTEIKQRLNEHQADEVLHGIPLSVHRSNKDANRIFTTIEYKRADAKLAKKSVLSGGTSPKYTTRTVTYYDKDGSTVLFTKKLTLNYTGDDLTSEVLS